MDDGLNAGEESDRLLVHWPVEPEEVAPPETDGAHAALTVGRRRRAGGRDRAARGHGDGDAGRAARRRGAARGTRPGDRAAASAWRGTFREVYAGLHEQGWRVRGFVRSGQYVLDRPHHEPETP